jgi:hypothetical protein
MASKQAKWVIRKNDLYANVNGAFGGKPKVYNTMRAAQYDISTNAALKNGIIVTYTGGEEAKTPGFATTTKAKAKPVQAGKPRRAADGLAGGRASVPGGSASLTMTAAGARAKAAIKPTSTPKRAAAGK